MHSSQPFDPSKPTPPPTFFGVLWSFLKRTPPHHLFYLLLLYFLPSVLIMVLHVNAFHADQLSPEPMVHAAPLEADYYKKPGCHWVMLEEAPRDVFKHPGELTAYVVEGADRKIARFTDGSYNQGPTQAHAWIHSQGLRECGPSHPEKSKDD